MKKMKLKTAAVLIAVAALYLGALDRTHAIADGDLDLLFDTDGKVTTDFSTSGDVGNDVVIQPDGKIVVAGTANIGVGAGAVARYNTDGSLDTSFDGDGRATTAPNISFSASAAALQADGKIVVAGVGRPVGQSDFDFVLARFNADGSLDTTFNSTGMVVTRFSIRDDLAQDVTIQTDGKIVAAGQTFTAGGSTEFALARYNTNGTLDTSFDGDGMVSTSFAAGGADARAVFVQPDGKIVAAGNRNLARYLSDGALDATFGGGGRVLVNTQTINDAVLQPDGNIVVAGFADAAPANSAFAVARLTAGGVFDTSFNGNGRILIDIGAERDEANAVAISSDGKIAIAGLSNFTPVFAVARLNANGTPDATFGGDGNVTASFAAANSAAFGIAIQPDGKIVAAGRAGINQTADFGAARFEASGTQATNVTLAGRAIAADGRGLAKTIVTITDAGGGGRSAITSPFGYYVFENVTTGQTYTLTARKKGVDFANSPQIVFIDSARSDLNFTALP